MAGLLGAAERPPVKEQIHDFDGDGKEERLISGPSGSEIQTEDPATGAWGKADFQLPDAVSVLDDAGSDAGLRFVDLNDDGFDDILFSNPKRFAIFLWTKNVQPQLGWTRGWTQFVRSGERTGGLDEPPNLVGSEVTVEGDQLLVVRRDPAGNTTSLERFSPKRLIAYQASAARSPEDGLASIRVRPGFHVELVAAEPVVIDPVAFDWGADGRLWVVEMGDYPSGMDGQGEPGGVIKVIQDTDGDGRYDLAIPFIEKIGFPSSLMPWRNGVLIAAAPDILYAEDTNGDGRADLRRVLFTGFNPGNQQHRINGFQLGLDGWIYAANGDSGGRVKSVATEKVMDIRGRDIRFRPDTGEMETVSASTQYGRRRDDWGNWFGNNNPTWLWHVTLPEHYLRRNPKLAVRSVKKILANYEDSTRVFPISPEAVRPNQPWSINNVTSACSPTPYRDTLFGADFGASVFISEPVHNTVHREVLEPDGETFSSHRAAGEEQSEFLASSDNWFRPTTSKVGPDGALYVADMYRLMIEHPEWISPELQARVDLRAGSDRGRIYRVVPDGVEPRPIPDLTKLDDHELATAMNSPSGWQRDTVQRLLLERKATFATIDLARLLEPTFAPQIRLQSLATMGMLGTLDQKYLLQALNDPHPAVRCEALRQSEAWGGKTGPVLDAVLNLADDSDPRVRFQGALSLGAWPLTLTERSLAKLSDQAGANQLLRIAVMSSLPPDSELFTRLNSKTASTPPVAAVVSLTPSSPDRARVISTFSGAGRLDGDPVRGRAQFQLLCAPCHRLRDEGTEVGPDLAMVSTKPVDWLLAAILDPSQAVEARYRPWAIRLNSGEELSGIITAETANNLVLRMAGGVEHAVLRTDIESAKQQELSLMPSGFESALSLQAMADLLAWLRAR
ncbi:MAG TPA: PVC-type heme-binding CxxCH protein [Verrucomicrobiae bacterium]|nr:PVC-type heme-binding CxxCH protein [Verrucomicrobiae bacterium]